MSQFKRTSQDHGLVACSIGRHISVVWQMASRLVLQPYNQLPELGYTFLICLYFTHLIIQST